MPTYYCTDDQVTAWLPTLTDSVIATADQRTAKLRTPAKVWIDSVFPDASPFVDVAASPATPDIVQQAATYYAAALGFSLLSKNAEDEDTATLLKLAMDLLKIDETTGLARVRISGIGSSTRLGVVDVTRSRAAEDRDEDDNQRELYP